MFRNGVLISVTVVGVDEVDVAAVAVSFIVGFASGVFASCIFCCSNCLYCCCLCVVLADGVLAIVKSPLWENLSDCKRKRTIYSIYVAQIDGSRFKQAFELTTKLCGHEQQIALDGK